ncbi:DEAD/DEAH box helicase family protein [Canibacter sp. lx-45]|uniref:DEAD/DEAH box helicase n=1 Tax=Canibacter zhuwentaonis TaxID=2837491 RepID=UPI001BDD4DE7|nr:DEAD/DEAH box helicase family protein [Canibacter zhuwentaonis]MBT1035905.1 DEAD/DEAH box helicase family protein [Canibacter zhuwentaonis]
MELKKYQKNVIGDLRDYLACLREQDSLSGAFAAYWESRQIHVGKGGIAEYQNTIEGVPHVCYKVPTGGGKTFLACASVKLIFDALPVMRRRATVWLVPSDSILKQTLRALKDPQHPYRQRLNADFNSRVEVYSKEELLVGQNFSPATVAEQLSVMVLSYDSFRAARKDGRKAYQANGNLASFATVLGLPARPIEKADETALFQVINQLNPVVIVDESHHTTSTLSHEMLSNFNPAFILDLTATPKQQSNIISYVDAVALKHENMVKLPVIACNRASQKEVITCAIDLQQRLETMAKLQESRGGRYIRPIVLFQAQPKTGEDATSFEKLREKLVTSGIPEEQIAIKTATINELKNVELLSRECPIRYIITVNALKEGWDCSFAYILASLANKTSQVDVEQILGRVLRQPHATRQREQLLNMSYVLTSSNDFNATLSQIVAGLNSAGFSKHDYRATAQIPFDFQETADEPVQVVSKPSQVVPEIAEVEEFLDFDENEVSSLLEQNRVTGDADAGEASSSVAALIIEDAQRHGVDYEQQIARRNNESIPVDLRGVTKAAEMIPGFVTECASLKIPQFVIQTPPSALFSTGGDGMDLLTHEALAAGFKLSDKDIRLDLSTVDEQMYTIDVKDNADVPRAFRMNTAEQKFMREHFSKLNTAAQKRNAAAAIYERLKQINLIKDFDIRAYIKRIVDNFGIEELLTYREHPNSVADKIRDKISGLLAEYKAEKFYKDVETRRISLCDTYTLPQEMQLSYATSTIGGSLYAAEDRMNNDEMDFALSFSGMSNVRWWHRNIERKGFAINGPFNHYPDFIVMTTSGTVVVVESKGEHLKNDDSQQKIKLGKKWESLAGDKFRYYMVFQDGATPPDGALNRANFLEILKEL